MCVYAKDFSLDSYTAQTVHRTWSWAKTHGHFKSYTVFFLYVIWCSLPLHLPGFPLPALKSTSFKFKPFTMFRTLFFLLGRGINRTWHEKTTTTTTTSPKVDVGSLGKNVGNGKCIIHIMRECVSNRLYTDTHTVSTKYPLFQIREDFLDKEYREIGQMCVVCT